MQLEAQWKERIIQPHQNLIFFRESRGKSMMLNKVDPKVLGGKKKKKRREKANAKIY